MTRKLVVAVGDGVGREVVPLALRLLRTLVPDVEVTDAECGWGHAVRQGPAIESETIAAIEAAGAALIGPERPFPPARPDSLTLLAPALDLYAALYAPAVPVAAGEMLHLTPFGPASDAADGSGPAAIYAATRVGNLAGRLARLLGGPVALAHDSEEPFAHAVQGGVERFAGVERVDALFLANHTHEVASEYRLLVTSRSTRALLLAAPDPEPLPADSGGRLLFGARSVIAGPAHGPRLDEVGWGFTDPLGTVRAVALLLRYWWEAPALADRLEAATMQALAHRRPPAYGGLHGAREVVWALLHALES